MLHIKKHRHKPLYKQFIRLRENIQNRHIIRIKPPRFFPNKPYYNRKITHIKFKKRKWENFIKYLKKRLKNKKRHERKKNFKMYDIYLYYIPKFPTYFNKKFFNVLIVKKRLSLFYGGLLKSYLKKQINITLKKTNYSRKNFGNINFFFFKILESRLDTVLYRSFFTLSIRSARQLINHGHVFVNKKKIKTNSFILKKGDLIEINQKYHKLINKNIQQSFTWPMPPKYLLINFRTFQILFHENIENTNFSTHFPFWSDINTLIKYYR